MAATILTRQWRIGTRSRWMLRLRTSLARLGLGLVGILVALCVAEGIARVSGVTHPNLYRADAHGGYSLRPGMTGWWANEGRGYVRISRDGLRDRPHAVAKPPGVTRIAVLGDSFAEALQVPQEATFWSVLQQ